MMTESITGECFCGSIRYEISGPLEDARSCHCSRCRKAFSGAGSAVAGFGQAKFRWMRGEEMLTTYLNKHEIGLGFCSQCGSTLCNLSKGQVIGITLGTLNGHAQVKIGRHIFVDSKAGWDEIGGTAPQFGEWPPGSENRRI
jgi:hypothetical protein